MAYAMPDIIMYSIELNGWVQRIDRMMRLICHTKYSNPLSRISYTNVQQGLSLLAIRLHIITFHHTHTDCNVYRPRIFQFALSHYFTMLAIVISSQFVISGSFIGPVGERESLGAISFCTSARTTPHKKTIDTSN
ncbi:hypothetical protein EJF18_20683 [Clavispora lusitaniae]|uniref:Uncharacterized protein n=1 Tax=Clavispora lusitaniae TaxID=36911 RepID=A0ACD0WHG6_CLALS|nr:hypothetical protein EJF14_20683 [Clavispora lusitaniae]QFZ32433.1 hypothetical protein EJF16_20683 [Clavispora lusitaniae]QFZ38102.1 hypothetical protein EJF15_20683 [Clavispora lusitaniae]QFZ43785.1 hypothetical protein EJF18_20683 [Clavispora lusitaniae]QFZ49462.1 hypothetical protein EJF17_20683 [Clavispora lusitaniae]